jgi:membrane protease YdiL (CAAX protease family)
VSLSKRRALNIYNSQSRPAATLSSARPSLQTTILVAALVIWNATSDALYRHFDLDDSPLSPPGRLMMIAVGSMITCGGIVGLGCVVWGRTSLRNLGWTMRGQAVRLILFGLVLTALFTSCVFGVYAGMGGRDGVQTLALAITAMPKDERLFFFIMGTRNAFLEETLFRGALLQALAERWGLTIAIVLSSAMHALHHRTLEAIPLLVKFVFALVASVVTVRARSLWPSAIAHALLWAIAGNS